MSQIVSPIRRWRASGGFTLVEMLVVIAIIAMLMALLLPAISKARRHGLITQSAAYQRTLGLMYTQYYADCKEFIPSVSVPHTDGNTNAYLLGGNAISSLNTNGTMAQSCPDNPNPGSNFPRSYPIGIGWFFYQGYATPPAAKTSLGMWTCPAAPKYTAPGWNVPIAQGRENLYSGFSSIAKNLYNRTLYTGVNPEGGNWHEVGYAPSGWASRGVMRASSSVAARRVSQWRPGDAILVCFEWTTSAASGGFLDCHDEGLNILFFDGHVKFGGKRIAGYEPFIYYSMVTNGRTLSEADGTAGTGSHSGYAYPGNNGMINLWNYYSQQ